MEEKIINDYINGKSLRQIAKEYHVNRNRISKLLKEKNVKIRTQKETSRKYTFNENYFESIDTEDKAYWLGFIYADGFITNKRKNGSQSLGITLSLRDISHLRKFKNSISATNPINTYYYYGFISEGYPATQCSRILLPSQKLVDDIKKHGVIEHKTKIITFPKNLNDNLIPHFVRGYMDGDGSIFVDSRSTYHLSFCGTKEFLQSLNEFFNETNKISFEKEIYSLHFSGNIKVKR